MDVAVNVSHTWVGDLIVTLTHDSTGTRVVLIDRPGVPATDFGCGVANIDATLDDEAALPADDACAPVPPALSGRLRPNEPLARFDGEGIAGTWTIRVSDNSPEDVGTLNHWALVATLFGAGRTPPAITPSRLLGDVNCDGVVNSVDAALLLQFAAGVIGSLACQGTADVNKDGSINSIDAALILQFSAGLLTRLPPP